MKFVKSSARHFAARTSKVDALQAQQEPCDWYAAKPFKSWKQSTRLWSVARILICLLKTNERVESEEKQ